MHRVENLTKHLSINHCSSTGGGKNPHPEAASGGGGRRRPGKLEGKVSIITGAASGIGEATARLFVEEGSKVFCADIDLEGLNDVIQSINNEFPGFAAGMKCDVGNEVDAKQLVFECVRAFGKLDCYFANAGVLGKYIPIEQETEESYMKTMKINSLGPFMAIKYASKAMKETVGSGSIVLTSSIAAIRSDITPLQYAASKGSVMSLVISANHRLLADKVRVNGVLPGGVATPIFFGVAKDLEDQGLRMEGYDMERFPVFSPTDIAHIVVFLCSDESVAIKGHCIVADGGMSMAMDSQPALKKITKKKKEKKS